MRFKLLFFTLLVSLIEVLQATPSSVFWTNCTTEVLSTGTVNLNVDNYFTLFNRRGHNSYFSPDVGLLFGLFTWNGISSEAGIDLQGGTDRPLFFNAKLGIPEKKLFCDAPSFSLGIFGVGTQTSGQERTNANVLDAVVGKTLPNPIGGNFYVGGYSGSSALRGTRQGFMVAYTRFFKEVKHVDGSKYHKWEFGADYASGKNLIGGGGFALTYYFTPSICIQTGPVWFNSSQLLGNWKWSIQIYMAFDVFTADKKAEE